MRPHDAATAALDQAAAWAKAARTVDQAVAAAYQGIDNPPGLPWSADPDSPHAQARAAGWSAWCRAEDHDHHPSSLGWVLRHRHGTVAGVVEGLARALEIHTGGGAP
jgi:hypothetical protein